MKQSWAIFPSWSVLWISVLSLAVAAPRASAAGAGDPAPARQARFVLFHPQRDKFWTECVNYAKAAAGRLDTQLEAVDFDFNREFMLHELEKRFETGVDGLIFQPSGTDAEAVFALAERYRVPTILINTDVDLEYSPRTKYRQWIAKIIPADQQAGELLMARLCDAARLTGTKELHVLAIGGTPGQGAADLRCKGMEQSLEYQSDVKSRVVDHGDWLPERAAAVFREQFEKNPQINVVWVANDNMALGVRAEMDRMGIAKPPVIGGIDWSREAVAAVGAGRVQVTIGGHFMEGALAVALLYDYVHGKDFAAEGVDFRTGMTSLTAETLGPVKQFQELQPTELHLEKLSKTVNPELKYYSFEIRNIIRTIIEAPPDEGAPLSKEDREWLSAQAGHFVLGVEQDYPPFSFVDKGGVHQGLAVDYLKLLESRLKIHFARSEPAALGPLLAAAKDQRIQVLIAVKSNPERRQYLHFTRPFIDVPVVLLTAGAAGSRLEDFQKGTIATAKGYGVTDYLTREHPEVRLSLFADDYEAMMSVVLGKTPAAVVDIATANYLIRQHGISSLKIAGALDFSYNLAFASTDARLARILDDGLASISPAARKQLHDAWFTQTLDTMRFTDSLTSNERAWLDKHPVLRVGYDSDWVPFEYVGRDGKRLGISGEYLKQMERLLKVRFEYSVDGPWSDKYAEASVGKLDLLSCITRTPEREKSLAFTSPYASTSIVVYARNSSPMLASLAQLDGKTLAVVKGYATEELFRSNHPGIKLLAVDSVRAGLDRLERGDCFAFADALVSSNYYLAQAGYTDLRVAGGTPYNYELAMAARDPVLAAILEKALAVIPADDRDAMARKWFAIHVEQVADYSLLWKILLPLLAALGLFAYWNQRLQREIGQRRRAEAELVRSQAAIEAANHELEAFSYSVSHDLRAPLRHICGYARMLQEDEKGRLSETGSRYLDTVVAAANRMGTLIDDLLQFSRTSRAEIRHEPVDLAGIVEECRDNLAPELSGRTVEWEIGEMPTALADRALIRQVFANLLGNAVKYTRKQKIAKIQVSARSEGGVVTVCVRDNGVGFDMKYADKLFGVFQRLHSDAEFEGTGIGLANVRQIITRHGGRIWAESEVDKGAAFYFTLPAATNVGQ